MDTKDLAFIAQNSGAHAASLVASAVPADSTAVVADLTDEFIAARNAIYHSTLELLNADADAIVKAQAEAQEAAAARRAEAAFGGTTQSTAAAPAPAASGGRVKVLKPLEGQDIPAWLEKQVLWLVGKGDIPDAGVIEVWDNRRFLPQFGGNKSEKGPWFSAKEKLAGEQYAAGIWPPRAR